MRSGEYKLRLGVALQAIRGRGERDLSVAGFAAVGIRGSGELSAVHVRVALRTSGGFELVFRIFPAGLVALSALHGGVLAFQRKTALLVLFARVQRRLETGFRVARSAITPSRPGRELAFVHILMAIGALFMSDGLFEIGVLMTLEAARVGVLSVERELGQIVIESRFVAHRFPAAGHVAGLAGALEGRIDKRAAVRIGVAILATGEAQSLVPGGRTPRCGRVALHAVQALVAPCQRIRGTAVIEARCRLPGLLRMAVRAFVAQLPAVRILMARRALGGQSKEGVVKVLHLHLGPNRGHDALRIVAILAG